VDSDVRRGAAVALVEIDPKWAKAEAALRAVSTAATPLKGSGTDTRLGVLFDIDKLGEGLFEALDTALLPGCMLSDGDTHATLT
jgi:hypothetical protein